MTEALRQRHCTKVELEERDSWAYISDVSQRAFKDKRLSVPVHDAELFVMKMFGAGYITQVRHFHQEGHLDTTPSTGVWSSTAFEQEVDRTFTISPAEDVPDEGTPLQSVESDENDPDLAQ
jgi:hypothetical protein